MLPTDYGTDLFLMHLEAINSSRYASILRQNGEQPRAFEQVSQRFFGVSLLYQFKCTDGASISSLAISIKRSLLDRA